MTEHACSVRLRNNLFQSCSIQTLELDFEFDEKCIPLLRTCMDFVTQHPFPSFGTGMLSPGKNCPFPFLSAIVTVIELTSPPDSRGGHVAQACQIGALLSSSCGDMLTSDTLGI